MRRPFGPLLEEPPRYASDIQMHKMMANKVARACELTSALLCRTCEDNAPSESHASITMLSKGPRSLVLSMGLDGRVIIMEGKVLEAVAQAALTMTALRASVGRPRSFGITGYSLAGHYLANTLLDEDFCDVIVASGRLAEALDDERVTSPEEEPGPEALFASRWADAELPTRARFLSVAEPGPDIRPPVLRLHKTTRDNATLGEVIMFGMSSDAPVVFECVPSHACMTLAARIAMDAMEGK
jgi:hypothetical protein